MRVQIRLLAGWMLGCGRILVSTWETQQGTSSHYQRSYLSVFVNSTKYWVGIFICNYDVLNHFRQVFWPQQQNSLPYNFNHNGTVVNISTLYNIQSTSQYIKIWSMGGVWKPSHGLGLLWVIPKIFAFKLFGWVWLGYEVDVLEEKGMQEVQISGEINFFSKSWYDLYWVQC